MLTKMAQDIGSRTKAPLLKGIVTFYDLKISIKLAGSLFEFGHPRGDLKRERAW